MELFKRPKQPKWKIVEYSKNQIKKAGKVIKHLDSTSEQMEEATKIIDNWRAAHAFPLHVIYTHLRRMALINKRIVVAERLKRLDSIINKLKREKTMSLLTMQDLGGCRFIVPRIKDVYKYADIYDKSRKRHIFREQYDYIKQPKSSGYRSLHKVYTYHSDAVDTYNGNLFIEIQFRTRLQHLWATAVETMGLFTKTAIKSGQGSDEIKRFFALISSLFALKENQPVVPGTSSDQNELIREIKEIDNKYHFLDKLSAFRSAVRKQETKMKQKQGYYILFLDNTKNMLKFEYFKPSQIEVANETYSNYEKMYLEPDYNTVLVRVSSFNSLKKAYPNYFSDISDFRRIVKDYLK